MSKHPSERRVQGFARGPSFRFNPSPLPASPAGRVLHEDLGISIDREGVWYYHGSPIRRKELICLFASALARDEAGNYWLVTPAEMGRIRVEDAPLLAVELFRSGAEQEQVISLRTNVDQIVTVDRDHPLDIINNTETGEPSPYIALQGGIKARLTRPVYYDLVSLGVEKEIDGEHVLGVWSSGCFFLLGKLDDVR